MWMAACWPYSESENQSLHLLILHGDFNASVCVRAQSICLPTQEEQDDPRTLSVLNKETMNETDKRNKHERGNPPRSGGGRKARTA